MRFFLFLLILCFLCFPVFSQEEHNPELESEPGLYSILLVSPGSDSVFIIDSFEFNIKGFTRPDALIRKGEFIKGEEITGLSNFEKYIRDKTQLLFNERVLETVSIDYVVGQVQEDGRFPVNLIINTIDTWNIVAIPRPRYSSNSGFDIVLKARDYNFLGTMSPLRLDIGYIYNEEKQSSLILELDALIPFRAFGLDWSFKFDNSFSYRPDTEQPYYYKNTTGLYVDLPVGLTTLTVGFDESIFVNEENEDIYKHLYGNFQEGLSMSSSPYITWRIPAGIDIGRWGELVYTPGISAVFTHEFPQWPLLDESKKGPVIIFRHNLGFKRIDWIENFRKGLDVYIRNSFDYNFHDSNLDKNPLTGRLTISGTGHFTLTDYFGISSRLLYRQWFFHEYGYTKAGDVMRGILDKDICTDYMLSLNLDFPVRVLRFSPSEWLNNQKLRIFNFDLHFSPFVDAALYHEFVKNIEFDILVTGGAEVIIFPAFFRSLYLCVSIGWDLLDFSNGRKNEIFIGTDFHY